MTLKECNERINKLEVQMDTLSSGDPIASMGSKGDSFQNLKYADIRKEHTLLVEARKRYLNKGKGGLLKRVVVI